MDRWNAFAKICVALIIVGAINWGLVGFFNWNLVEAIFGGGTTSDASALSRVIYAVVGLAGVAAIFLVPWEAKPVKVRHDPALGRRVEA